MNIILGAQTHAVRELTTSVTPARSVDTNSGYADAFIIHAEHRAVQIYCF
jgi:hypothetical protein